MLGALPPLPIATPWWQDIAPVVEAFHARHGFEPTILRLLSAGREEPPGGAVTYLAEVDKAPPEVALWAGELGEHPLRQAYARPGGPAADLAWAWSAMGVSPGEARQVRTWNLSSLWRLKACGAAAWLKVVPPFFAHEGRLLRYLAGGATPTVIATNGARSLLAEIPGEDLYFATRAQHIAMIDVLVEIQRAQRNHIPELLALGVADWRSAALLDRIVDLARRTPAGFDPRLEDFVAGLPARMAAIEACGAPETLVHGDFHPGNFRGEGESLTLLDWGDAAVGSPLLDEVAFLDWVAPDDRLGLQVYWRRRWRDVVPGFDPDRASLLLAPVSAALKAAVCQGFLDRIEPSEHPYHAADPANWLRRALALAEQESR